MRLVTAIFSALLISLTAHAKEGFDVSPSWLGQKSAWEETFALTDDDPETPGITASVLVFKKVAGTRTYLGFLTSGHSLSNLLKKNKLEQLSVSRNIRMINRLDLLDPVPGRIITFDVNMNYELGLFIMQIPTSRADAYTPVPFASNCFIGYGTKLQLYGFPGVFQRQIEKQKEKIQAPNLITKRSSEGFFTGENRYGQDQRYKGFPILGTTADAMPGNSGGPAINDAGEVIGILIGSRASPTNGNSYQGFEGRKILLSHSFVTGCRITKEFSLASWTEFLQSLHIDL